MKFMSVGSKNFWWIFLAQCFKQLPDFKELQIKIFSRILERNLFKSEILSLLL